ncbi:MAG TPA: branched-chain amino acid ABC transporter permease [Acidimicrobiales bacterium]|nr:branched-chain amino acid ABC transporter permease [Acidimicrobiales bacterium]
MTASILSLGAVGFTLQYGMSNVFNLAFAGVMAGAEYVALAINRSGVNIWICMALAALFGGFASLVLNKFVYMPFIRRGVKAFGMVIITLSVWTVIQYVILAIVGSTASSFRVSGSHLYVVGAIRLNGTQLIVIAIAVVLLLLLEAFLRMTLWGKAVRGAAANAPLARTSGINVARVMDVTWFISGVFAGVAGVALAMNVVSFTYTTAGGFLVVLVAAAILGGVGRPSGAMFGALIVGLATEVSAAIFNPAYKDVTAFVLLAIVLVAKPAGLFPEAVQRKEVVL